MSLLYVYVYKTPTLLCVTHFSFTYDQVRPYFIIIKSKLIPPPKIIILVEVTQYTNSPVLYDVIMLLSPVLLLFVKYSYYRIV